MTVTDGARLDELVCLDLYAASRAMTRRYRPLLEHHGLTYPQYLVLVMLGSSGPSTITELSVALRLDHATLAPLVRRLETTGQLARRRPPHDGRAWLLELTDAGRSTYADSERVQCQVAEDLGLSDAEVVGLQRTLRRVAEAADAAYERDRA